MTKYAKVKRILSSLLSISLLSLFFISVNGVGVESKTTLSVMMGNWWRDQGRIIKEKYEQTHPDIELTFRFLGFAGMREKLIAELIAHRAADVSWAGGWAPGFAGKDLIAPWDEYVGPDKAIKPEWFVPQALEQYYLNGHQWSIPFRAGADVLLCNRNMFEEAGLDPDVYPTNVKELKEYARLLTNSEKNVYGFVWEAACPDHFDYVIQKFLWNFGADLINKEGTEATINSPSAVEAIDFLASFLREGLIPKASMGYTDNGSYRFFAARKAAMVLSCDGGMRTIEEVWPDINWSEDIGGGIMEHPVVYLTGLIMPKNPEHPEESARFVGWFIENLPELTIRVPCTVRKGDWINRPQWKWWVEQVSVAKEKRLLIPQIDEIRRVVRKQTQRACLGEATVKEAMNIAAAEINKVLSR